MTARGDIGPTTGLTDLMHIVLGVVDTLLMLSILGFGAAALGRQFRLYSPLTLAVVLAGGASTFAFVPLVAAGASTPVARGPRAHLHRSVPAVGGGPRHHPPALSYGLASTARHPSAHQP